MNKGFYGFLKKVFVLNKKKVAAICGAIVLLIGIIFGQDVKSVVCGYALKKLPIYYVDRDDKKIAISFDCAWGNEYTAKILEETERYGVRCTFFTVSFWAEKYPDDLKRIAERHEVGTHSKTHPHMSKLSQTAVTEELDYSCRVIEETINKPVTLFRAPFGEYNDNVIEQAEKKGLYVIQWDVDSLDWKNLSASDIALRVISKVKSGSIILCHNNGLHTAESLPLIFSDLQSKGYEFVPIGELIYKNGYVMGHDGAQIKKID